MSRFPRVRASSLLTAAALAAASLTSAVLGAPAASAATCANGGANGPDISGWQHPNGATIDWDKVAGSCNAFAIVKATEGTGYTNPYFESDWIGAGAAGLIRGAYHFARPALPMSSATAQADRFASVIGSMRYSDTLPPILDLEENGGLSAASLITWTQTFLAELQRKTGRTPMIYTYRYFWSESMASTAALRRYPLWIADYTTASQPHTPLIGSWSKWRLWQYTAGASVRGISGPVDRSRFNGTLDDLATFADGAHARTLAVRAPAAPIGVHASASGNSATVSWIPTDNGGSLVSTYTVTATPGGATTTVSGAGHIATISGLKPGTQYQFSVVATNAAGLTSSASSLSNVVSTYVPVSITVSGTTSVKYAGKTTLTATMRRGDTGALMPDRRVVITRLRAGSSTWKTEDTLRTGSDGTVGISFTKLERSSFVRFRFPGHGAYLAASKTRSLTVRPIVTAQLSATSVRSGDRVRLTGTVKPNLSGATVYRQGYYDGGWHTWATAKVSSTGTFSFTIRPTVRTTDVYRVYIGSTSRLGSGTSPRLSLRVR